MGHQDPESVERDGPESLIFPPYTHRLLCPPPPLPPPLCFHLSSWLLKLLINAWVLFLVSFYRFTESPHVQLSKEYVAMQKEPPPFVWAAPDEKDILICALSLSRHGSYAHALFSREFYHRGTRIGL